VRCSVRGDRSEETRTTQTELIVTAREILPNELRYPRSTWYVPPWCWRTRRTGESPGPPLAGARAGRPPNGALLLPSIAGAGSGKKLIEDESDDEGLIQFRVGRAPREELRSIWGRRDLGFIDVLGETTSVTYVLEVNSGFWQWQGRRGAY
jgi:hypothetical protein